MLGEKNKAIMVSPTEGAHLLETNSTQFCLVRPPLGKTQTETMMTGGTTEELIYLCTPLPVNINLTLLLGA